MGAAVPGGHMVQDVEFALALAQPTGQIVQFPCSAGVAGHPVAFIVSISLEEGVSVGAACCATGVWKAGARSNTMG